LTLLPFYPRLPRIRREEPAIKNELAGDALSDAELERLLALARWERRSGSGAGTIRPNMERDTKLNSSVGNFEKETRHEDET
jgi:hypothetical protein